MTLDRLRTAFFASILRHRWLVIGLCVAVTVAAGLGMPRLEVDPSARVFLVEGSPEKIALDRLETAYSKDENVTFLVRDSNGDAFSRESLAAVAEITQAAWRVPHTRRVDSLTNFQHARAEADDIVVADLVENPADAPAAALEAARRVALDRPDVVGRLVSADGRTAAVQLIAIIPDDHHRAVIDVVAGARAIAADAEARHPGIEIRLTGVLMLNAALAEAAERDKRVLIPVMIGIILVIVAASLRSANATGLTLAVIAASVVVALGLAGWAGIQLNPASTAAPIIIMTLAVASCVHILSTYRFTPRLAALGQADAVTETMRLTFTAVAITSLTTVIGFLSLNFSKVAPFRDLGNIVACGMVASFFFSVVLLPALMGTVRLPPPTATGREQDLMGRLARAVVARHRWVLVVSGGLAVFLVVGMTRIVFDDNFVGYFDDSYQFRVDADYAEEVLGGLTVFEYSVPAAGPNGITDPAYMKTLEEFAAWLRRQPRVDHVLAVPESIKRLNQAMHGDDPAYLRIPEDREVLAQLLLLYELSLPFGLDLTDRILVDKSATRVTVITENVSSAETKAIANAGSAWLDANAPPYMAAQPTGIAYTFAFVSERNTRAMFTGAILALALISGILVVLLGSASIGALSLIPNLLPVMMAFGLWGYLVREINLAVSVVGTMTLGVVVDDTVHILAKYLAARRDGAGAAEAVVGALRQVGPAVIITSLALIAGFGVLATSGFAVNGNMGLLAAITVALALLADLFLLPALLVVVDRRGERGVSSPPSGVSTAAEGEGGQRPDVPI